VSKLVPDSRGRHALLALLDQKSQKDLAKESGVAQSALSLIASRQRRPGREAAGKLVVIGIEFAWWGKPPTADQLKRDAVRQAAKEPAA
jgi:hypothetical protein